MARTLFNRRTLHVAAKVDDKGPRLEFFAAGEDLDHESVNNLIFQLQTWVRDIRMIGICPECNVRTPLHKIGCRQAPLTY